MAESIKECLECKASYRRLGKHIRLVHQMSLEEYFIRHHFDSSIQHSNKHDNCSNLNCTNKTKFLDSVRGYELSCSRSCSATTTMKDAWTDERKEEQSERLSGKWNSGAPIEVHAKQCSDRINERHSNPEFIRNQWLSRCRNKNVIQAYFYISFFEDRLKIGISMNDPRLDRLPRIKSSNYTIYKSTPESIADIERQIKQVFNAISDSEWFSISDEKAIFEQINKNNLIKQITE